ncbi:hypothetical protein KKC59_04675 [bacterium]|nr:hypothetical protein [bacterium]
MISFDRRLIDINLIRNAIKQLDRRIIFMTLGAVIGLIIVINKGFQERYNKSEISFEREMKRIDLAKNVISLKEKDKAAGKFLLESSDVGLILSYVNNFLEKHKIVIISVNPQKTEKIGAIFIREIFIVIEGTYNQLIDLIADFESSEKFVYIEMLEIRKKSLEKIETSKQLEDPVLSANIRIKVFSS